MPYYAKVIVPGSPITKSNFKLHNKTGRAVLPYNSGQYNDRYGIYEQEIAYLARNQNPDVVLNENLIAVLKVYYKSSKRHPDTINITKSIFDGIEKSGLIVNDVQIKKIYTEENYDSENPRFELELYGESHFNISVLVKEKEVPDEPVITPEKKKNPVSKKTSLSSSKNKVEADKNVCSVCGKLIKKGDFISAENGKTLICCDCFSGLF